MGEAPRAILLNDRQREQVHQLLDDVRLIKELIPEHGMAAPEIARTTIAPMLRRWICEGQFHVVQKLIRPHIVKFDVWEMPQLIAHCERGDIEHWMSMIKVSTFAGSVALPKAHLVREDGTSPLSGRQDDAQKKISRASHLFFNQKIAFWRGKFYLRKEILTLHANKRGGVHFDLGESDENAVTDELARYIGYEVKGTNHQMLVGESLAEAKADRERRARTYDTFELVAMDTARTFADGIDASKREVEALLER